MLRSVWTVIIESKQVAGSRVALTKLGSKVMFPLDKSKGSKNEMSLLFQADTANTTKWIVRLMRPSIYNWNAMKNTNARMVVTVPAFTAVSTMRQTVALNMTSTTTTENTMELRPDFCAPYAPGSLP